MEKNIKGYRGFGPNDGIFVPTEAAFTYVCGKCGIKSFDILAPEAAEFIEMLVEWYFSSSWVEEGWEEDACF